MTRLCPMPVSSPYAVFRAEEWIPISVMPISAMPATRPAAGKKLRARTLVQGDLFKPMQLD